jgi:hypothetical protein
MAGCAPKRALLIGRRGRSTPPAWRDEQSNPVRLDSETTSQPLSEHAPSRQIAGGRRGTTARSQRVLPFPPIGEFTL